MRYIDVETWARREHYRLYRQFDQPHFNMCANVDLTLFYPALRRHMVPFTIGVLYVLARAANDIPAFRYRMRADDVVEHDTVHPATTVLSDAGLFGFCSLDYVADFGSFSDNARRAIEAAKQKPTLTVQQDRDDLLFTTAIPWVSFTSFAHPTHLQATDSIPRMAWGKRFEEAGRMKMPLSVQGHHAMMDGYHMGQYYELVQSYLGEPDAVLGTD